MCMLVWFPVKARHDERLYARIHQKNKSNCDLKRNKSNGKITVGLVSQVLRTTILWEHLSMWSSSAWEDAGSWTSTLWQLIATNQQFCLVHIMQMSRSMTHSSSMCVCCSGKVMLHIHISINSPAHSGKEQIVTSSLRTHLQRWRHMLTKTHYTSVNANNFIIGNSAELSTCNFYLFVLHWCFD